MSRKSNRLEHFTRIYKGKLYKFFRNGEEFYKTIEAYAKYPKQTKFEHFIGWFFWLAIFIVCVNGLLTDTKMFLIFSSIGIILSLLIKLIKNYNMNKLPTTIDTKWK